MIKLAKESQRIFKKAFPRSNPSSLGMHIVGSINYRMHSHAGAMGTREKQHPTR